MKKISKFKEADKVFVLVNPYEEQGWKPGWKNGIEVEVDRGREEEQIKNVLKILIKDYTDKQISDFT